jgi:hypothetical protein
VFSGSKTLFNGEIFQKHCFLASAINWRERRRCLDILLRTQKSLESEALSGLSRRVESILPFANRFHMITRIVR